MTLVQASICEQGQSIILMGDRLVTYSGYELSYEKESRDSKIYIFGKHSIGFAGSILHILEIVSKIQQKDTIEDFAQSITSIMSDIKENDMNTIIKQFTMRENKQEFQKEQQKIPPKFVNLIYAKYADYKTECESLIVGFDKNQKARIYGMLDRENFSTIDLTELHHYSIGSGTTFSMLYFDQESYDCNCTLEEGLYFAYRAKKNAEAHTGVGIPTDVVILQVGKKPKKILAEEPLIQDLNRFYEEEEKAVKEIRSRIFSQIKF